MRETFRAHLPPYDFLYKGIDLRKEIGVFGTRLLLPYELLHGTQRKEEYDEIKRKQVKAAFQKDEMDFLLEHPIIACAIPVGSEILLAIIDGHHRKRFAALHDISEIPCIITTPATIVEILNRKEEKKIDETSFITTIKVQIENARFSFAQPEQRYKKAQPILGISSIEQLQERYRSF